MRHITAIALVSCALAAGGCPSAPSAGGAGQTDGAGGSQTDDDQAGSEDGVQTSGGSAGTERPACCQDTADGAAASDGADPLPDSSSAADGSMDLSGVDAAEMGAAGAAGGEPSAGPGPDATGRVLIDASNGGGTWWFSPTMDDNYQGAAFTEHVRSLGLEVVELMRGDPAVVPEQLSGFELVIRANELAPPSDATLDAYEGYVRAGGSLFLLADFVRPGEHDLLAERLGLTLQGFTQGPQLVEFTDDPLCMGASSGVESFIVGSGVMAGPAGQRILARLDPSSYLDLDDDKVQDADEPTAPIVMGAFELELGQVVYVTDTNYPQRVPLPLTDNILTALMPSLQN